MSADVARKPSGQNQDPAVEKSIEFFKNVFGGTKVKPFAVRFWDGAEWRHGSDPPQFTLELKHPAALHKIFWRPTEVSLGEAFIFDDFDVHGDLESSFELGDYLLGRDWQLSEKIRLGLKLFSVPRTSQSTDYGTAELRGRAHSKQRDAEAVQYHYNVSNDFYRLWLDKYMIYSCALFHSEQDTIDEAQYRKLDYLCTKLRLKPGEKLLDIGCGWGGLIIHACRNYNVEA
ncbi:MAG: class I SAM-dependent methyltransferase, partial [Desulfuromonadales bacterium]|nr:class I SAM-dependent methyltransferase [Desulfuromonadales bacterium]NIS39712.1 class I SAM-dependent methyltransferase [Desulfuromonadales bacterium]